MPNETRRDFLADVGKGMLIASVGAPLALELGLTTALAGDAVKRLTFGSLETLVGLMQDTPVSKLQSLLVDRLRSGTPLKTLVTAGALANARSFGGQHYVGYHTLMALLPAYEMSRRLPADRAALPVLKVLYRNTDSIQKEGGSSSEVLDELHHHDVAAPAGPEQLVANVRARDMAGAERAFAALMKQQQAEQAYENLQFIVQDDIDVHRVVLAWRAWDTLRIAGREHAHTLLRQSVRHCVDVERRNVENGRPTPEIRSLLPRLLDQYKLLDRPAGRRQVPDGWVESMARQIFAAQRSSAADLVAAALAEGVSAEAVGEAISLAANLLVLHDPGRSQRQGPDKPVGSVHGASVGVHASDSANAWRNIARVSGHRNAVASLIVGAYHTAGQHGHVTERPFHEALEAASTDPKGLLEQIDRAIRDNDQARASGLVQRYGESGFGEGPVFNLLLGHAVTEDGALHAEKYYTTVCEEFATTRPGLRWQHVVALARVTASEYGRPAPGHAEARRLLSVDV
jgi:hypothetical protein